MALEHHDHAATHLHDEVEEVSSVHSPFGVAQLVSLVAGILFVVIGAVGLARAGLDSMTTPGVDVGAFRMTPLLALLQLAAGLIMMAGAADRFAARGIGMVLGGFLIAAGIVALIQPVRSLRWVDANGALYLVTGVTLLLGAMLTPPAIVSRRGVIGTKI